MKKAKAKAAPAAGTGGERSALPKRMRKFYELMACQYQLPGKVLAEIETWARKRMTVRNRQIIARLMLSLVSTRKKGVRHG
jgi:hypothetical protein